MEGEPKKESLDEIIDRAKKLLGEIAFLLQDSPQDSEAYGMTGKIRINLESERGRDLLNRISNAQNDLESLKSTIVPSETER